MSHNISYREYIENDFPILTDIVIKAWGFDNILSEKMQNLQLN